MPKKPHPEPTSEQRRFARNLRRIREQRGISQNELARRTGASQSAVNDWEKPEKCAVPFSDVLIRVARVLRTSVEELYGVDGTQDLGNPLGRAYESGGLAAITEAKAKLDELERQWSRTTPPDGGGEASQAQRDAHQVQSERGLRARAPKRPRRQESA